MEWWIWWIFLALALAGALEILFRVQTRKMRKVAAPAIHGDPALAAALAAARDAHREEHRQWEAEFCAALGVYVPQGGDPYNLQGDLERLDSDLAAQGVLYGHDAVTYMLSRHRVHMDVPWCMCTACNKLRKITSREPL